MRQLILALALIAISPLSLAADSADAEIQYLLTYVENSGCTFLRNGTEHDSAGAADHLRLKYSRGGKYAKNADQFIDRLASESSWTGNKYTVTCDGVTQPSGDWLHQALDDYRHSSS